MMTDHELQRWGLLLDVLVQMSDVERQVVVQVNRPMQFVPDDLLARWDDTFQGGFGLQAIGVSDEMLSILLEFDYNLEQLIDVIPEDTDEKLDYIRFDTVWRAIREMAEWTLLRLIDESTPQEADLSEN